MPFKELIKQRRAWYKTIGKIKCPILNEEVVFNSKGFYHLRYDSFGKARSVPEQQYKIGLLPLVIPVIKNVTKIFDYKKEQYSKPLKKFFEIWELRAVVGKSDPALVCVVLRRIGNGNITFLSVYKRGGRKKSKATQKPSR